MSIEYCWTSHMVTISNVFLQNQVSATVFTIDKEKFINNEYLNDISWIWTKKKQQNKKNSLEQKMNLNAFKNSKE